LCAEISGFCDCYDSWVWPNGELEDWEKTWEPTP
jgi:hypothetical protein